MGIGTFVEGAIDTSLTHYVTTYSHAVIGVLQPVAVTAVTSYVLWTGFQVMRGEAQDAVSSLVWKWFRVAMITGLALTWTDISGDRDRWIRRASKEPSPRRSVEAPRWGRPSITWPRPSTV